MSTLIGLLAVDFTEGEGRVFVSVVVQLRDVRQEPYQPIPLPSESMHGCVKGHLPWLPPDGHRPGPFVRRPGSGASLQEGLRMSSRSSGLRRSGGLEIAPALRKAWGKPVKHDVVLMVLTGGPR